jgi:adenosylcobyric acid synthase
VVVAEGAGAAVEPNLREGDIVNLRVARWSEAVTLLVADIDRGGAFGHLVGTLALMSDAERGRVKGLVLNRFRGDASLLTSAIVEVEERTGVPVLGVIPWIANVQIADEDAVALERPEVGEVVDGLVDGAIDIAVVHLPRIANFDDFDALRQEAGVSVRFVASAEELGDPDLIVLPGTKATIADLEAMRTRGLDVAVRDRAAAGTPVFGICGGYQMLGTAVRDELGAEAPAGSWVEGLGLLPVETVFGATKTTRRSAGEAVATRGIWAAAAATRVSGYEIHMGETRGDVEPLLRLEGRADGAVSADGRVAGTYLHGVFDGDEFRRAILGQLGGTREQTSGSREERREREFDRVAAVVREHLDMERVRSMLGIVARA